MELQREDGRERCEYVGCLAVAVAAFVEIKSPRWRTVGCAQHRQHMAEVYNVSSPTPAFKMRDLPMNREGKGFKRLNPDNPCVRLGIEFQDGLIVWWKLPAPISQMNIMTEFGFMFGRLKLIEMPTLELPDA